MDPLILTVSKPEAAKRQLETAIRLYFSNDDPVSIHTLAAAAAQVIQDLGKHHGKPPMILRGELLSLFRVDQQKEVRTFLAIAENFFKHADKDPEAILDFRLAHSELFILEGIEGYKALSSEPVPVFECFRTWYVLHLGRDMMMPAAVEEFRLRARHAFNLSSREAFFADALPATEAALRSWRAQNAAKRRLGLDGQAKK